MNVLQHVLPYSAVSAERMMQEGLGFQVSPQTRHMHMQPPQRGVWNMEYALR